MSVSKKIEKEYNITVAPGKKSNCPQCGHCTLSIKKDDSLAKCFHPGCDLVVKDDAGGEGGNTTSETFATVQPHAGCTLSAYSEFKKLPMQFLQGLGLSEIAYMGSKAIKIPYYDSNGTEIVVRFRTALQKSSERDDRFKWRTGSKPRLYGLWKLHEAIKTGYIVIVEGESDTQTLWYHNIPSIGLPGANSWKEEWAELFADIPVIYAMIEPDSGGKAIQKWLVKSALRTKVNLIRLENAKDASDIYTNNPESFIQNWELSIKNSTPWINLDKEEKAKRRPELWEKCKHIAEHPRILDLLVDTLHDAEVVGEDKVIKLLFLALTSRYFDKMISISVKGISSSGKSFVVEQISKFFPPEAYYKLTAMSDKAIIYTDESIEHRYLIVFEAVGMQSEILSYIIRSLLSEGEIRYWTVDGPGGEENHGRSIIKKGPTGLIITTTAHSLHAENETRLLSISINESEEQTAKILLSIANQNNHEINYLPWINFHKWLGLGTCKVVITYLENLAAKIPAIAPRLRRDFSQIKSLISAHALLHQANRDKDENGNIIASIDDYRIVRELCLDIISEGLDTSVPDEYIEIVKTVEALELVGKKDITRQMVCDELALNKSLAYRRIGFCLQKGYLKNDQDKKGHPAKLKIGDPLPKPISVLPLPEELEIDGCTVSPVSEGINTPPPPLSDIQSNPKDTDNSEYPSDYNSWPSDAKEMYLERIAICLEDKVLSINDAMKIVEKECRDSYDL